LDLADVHIGLSPFLIAGDMEQVLVESAEQQALGGLGYVLSGRRNTVLTGMLFLLFAFALVLIIDIDRPNGGGVRGSQRAMMMLRETLAAQPPSSFDRTRAEPAAVGGG